MGLKVSWLLSCDHKGCEVERVVGVVLLEKVIGHITVRNEIKSEGWIVTEEGRTICPACVKANPYLGRPDKRQLAKEDYREWAKRVDPDKLFER